LSRRRRPLVVVSAPRAPSVAIVGAGIAGLTCARKLRDAGHTVALFEQASYPGGRSATREEDFGQFDDGAQYFTARDPRFKSAISSWLRAGVVAEWRARIVRVTKDNVGESRERATRYVGYPVMRALADHLARGFNVGYERRVTRIERVEAGWTLQLQDGSQTLPYAKIIVATPAPQAGQLLASCSAELGAYIAAIEMLPCWAMMLQFEKAFDTRFDAAIVEDEPIAWLARESSKPGRKAGERWIVHASNAWSRQHFDADPDTVIAGLMTSFCELVEKRVTPAYAKAVRWDYALAASEGARPFLHDVGAGLGACGDWLVEGRVEGAFLSGLAMASELIQQSKTSKSAQPNNRESA
jgi:predicted NAD/FAD-dependent oxidoreductase